MKGGKEEFNPPTLASAVDDQPSQETSHQEGHAHPDVVLVVTGSLGETQEDEESAEKERGIVCHEDRPAEEKKVNGGYDGRNGILPLLPARGLIRIMWAGRILKIGELPAEEKEIEGVGEHDAEDGLPAEVGDHEPHVPIPSFGHHEDRRGCKMGEGATDGDVHEQKTDGGISEGGTWFQGVEPFGQQEGRNGHGSRFGDEGTQEGSEGQGGEPPRRRGAAEKAGHPVDTGFREPDDGSGGGDGHDDNDEERFGVGDVVTEVVLDLSDSVEESVSGGDALAPDNRSREGDDPDAKDSLNLSQGMEEPGAEGDVVLGVFLRFINRPPPLLLDHLAVPGLMEVSPFLEDSREEGVENGAGKDDGCDQVEMVLRNCPFPELFPEGVVLSFKGHMVGIGVGRQGQGKMGVLILLELPLPPSGVGGFPVAGRGGRAQS